MPLILKRMAVKGFLNHRDISINFDEKINFLTGRNGTGKTNFIRLLHACLSFDQTELATINFDEVNISFNDDETDRTPQIKIEKLSKRRPLFRYHFRQSGNEKFKSFSDTPANQEALFINSGPIRSERERDIRNRQRELYRLRGEIKELFQSKLNFSWLPLHRTTENTRHYIFDDDGEEQFESPIDAKISSLVVQMTRYFSTLDTRTAHETKAFQQEYFTSIVSYEPSNISNLTRITKSTDLQKQKIQMHKIFSEMGYNDANIVENVNSFYERAEVSSENISTSSAGIQIKDLFAVADTLRLAKIIDRFQDYEDRKKSIQKPKNDFCELISNMLLGKSLNIDEANQPVVTQDNGNTDKISLYDLSSGEKQLFIILCEALIQAGRRYIYIADEPEISLHVEWQESLVRSITSLNPNCQIVFATHSPDIVSIYQNNVIDFETV